MQLEEYGRLLVVVKAKLPACLRPQRYVDLHRLGPVSDGGYCIPPQVIARSEALVSLGVSADFRFEQDFTNHNDVPVYAFDHSVTKAFWFRRRVERLVGGVVHPTTRNPDRSRATMRDFKRYFGAPGHTFWPLMVGYDGDLVTSLDTVLRGLEVKREVYLKMDIEGWEWRCLDDIVANESSFSGISVEFHDVDLHLLRLCEFVASLSELQPVYVQVNNCSRILPDGSPVAIEVSFAREKDVTPIKTEPPTYRNCRQLPAVDIQWDASYDNRIRTAD